MIPRIAHFIWIDFNDEAGNRTAPPRQEAAKNIDAFRTAHPDWEVNVWDGERIHELVQQLAPDYYAQRFLAYPLPVMRVDAARYFILHELGGVYMDTDMRLVRPLDGMLRAHPSASALIYEEHLRLEDKIGVTNSFIASAPRSPLTTALVTGLQRDAREPAERPDPAELEAHVFATTGPVFLASAVLQVDGPDIARLRNEIRNCMCCGRTEVRAALRDPNVYLLNENAGSWKTRKTTLMALRRFGCNALDTVGISPSFVDMRMAKTAVRWGGVICLGIGILVLSAILLLAWRGSRSAGFALRGRRSSFAAV